MCFFEGLGDLDSIYFMLLDVLLWNCPGLVAQWFCGVFLIEPLGLVLSITRSLCLSRVEFSALPSLLIFFNTHPCTFNPRNTPMSGTIIMHIL